MPRLRRKVSTTCSLSPLRISPVSTYTQVSWWPIARWTSAAATDESTPPDRSADHPAVADLGLDQRDLFVDDRRHLPGRRRTRRARTGTARAPPCRTASGTTSGWNCTAQILRSTFSNTATGASGVTGRGDEPVRHLGDGVEVAHPHVVLGGDVVVQQHRRESPRCASIVRAAVLAAHPAAHDAAELLGDQLSAVADAEDRDPEVVDAGIERRRALDVHALRAARQDDRGRGAVLRPRRR